VLSRLRRSPALVGLAFALPTVALLAAFIGLPVLNALRTSLYESDMLRGERFVGLGNYARVFADPVLPRVLSNTLVWGVGSLVGQLGLGLLAALAINQPLRGVHFFRGVLLMPYVVPAITLALVWRWMLDGRYGILSVALQQVGLLEADQSPLGLTAGAMPSVIAANVWRGFPFAMLVYWAALQGIDAQQYEAARVDGANGLQEFWYVTLPNLRNATVALLVLRGIWTVTYFDLIWLITQGGPGGATEHWPVWIYREAMGYFRFGYASAIATVMGLALLAGVGVVAWGSRRRQEES
jgi:multiple sugar transport system permease protein